MLTLELQAEGDIGSCACCGQPIRQAMGGVYRNEAPHALYVIQWTPSHPDGFYCRIMFADDWSEDTPRGNITVFVIKVFVHDNAISGGFIEPSESPWPNAIWGTDPLTREQALAHGRKQEVFDISWLVKETDPRARQALDLR